MLTSFFGIKLKIRTNKILEDEVTKGVEFSLKGDDFRATDLMISQGVPKPVIAPVLYQHERIRSCDLSILNRLRS